MAIVDVPLVCADCGAYPHEICLCRARDAAAFCAGKSVMGSAHNATSVELERSRYERLSQHELCTLGATQEQA